MLGSNGDGAQRGLVTIVELIDLRPYKNQPAVYGRLIYTVIYMSDGLLIQENSNPHLTPPHDLRVRPWVQAELFAGYDHEAPRRLSDFSAVEAAGAGSSRRAAAPGPGRVVQIDPRFDPG